MYAEAACVGVLHNDIGNFQRIEASKGVWPKKVAREKGFEKIQVGTD